LEKLKANLQSITSFSRRQQKEKRAKEEETEKQTRRIKCLEDVISAAKQLAAETQLRQLNELQSPSRENKELKQTLTELSRQQQQPTAQEHHQGTYRYYWNSLTCLDLMKSLVTNTAVQLHVIANVQVLLSQSHVIS